MIKILVADSIAEEGLQRLRDTCGVEAELRLGLSEEALTLAVAEFDGLIIRSGIKVTRRVLSKPGRLRAIARAGVGVDNVDLAAATTAGVLVLNTPDANTLSTAEHTIAMMLALLRNIPQAHAHVAGGEWNRKAFIGRQAAGKVLGLIGFGRVGRAVAARALSLDMKVLAYDPFLRTETAMDGRVSLVQTIDELLPRVDCLSLHASLTEDSKKMINAERLKKLKASSVLINCARGGLVDEAALAHSLNNDFLAGAAIDVYQVEPPKGSPLLSCKNIVLTPHLGASTREAQTAVSIDAVDSLLDYLMKGTIRNAVNVTGLPADLSQSDRAFLDLTGRMAAVLSIWCAAGVDRVEVHTTDGQRLRQVGPTLALAAVVEMMSPHIEERLNLVNADSFARKRGIDILHSSHSTHQDYLEMVRVRFTHRQEAHEVEGTVFGDGRPRILAVDGYRMEMIPNGLLVMIFNDDRPGVIGLVGTVFGRYKINIADMFLSRREDRALMVLKCDGDVPVALLDELRGSASIHSVRTVKLPALSVNE